MVNSEIINRKDSLTGFHTKEGLNEYLHSKVTAVYEKTKNLSVIILDLDKFKDINDTYGHLVGDDALRFFSMIINNVLKGQHFVARYGGDEFVIVMTDSTDGKESLDIARRIKMSLQKEKFITAVGSMKLYSSIGISSFPHDGKTARDLMSAADQALYYVKKHGRGKVVSSRHLRKHSIKDRFALLLKLLLAVAAILLTFFTYQGAESLKGLVGYCQNISNYFQYHVHHNLEKSNYYIIELKDGKKIEGWVIRENAETVSVNMAKPTLKLNPLKLNSILSSPSVVIPKDAIQSSIKSQR